MGIAIKPSESVFIAARTGGGKTFIARKYLAGYQNVVCLDTKGTTVWPEVPGTIWDLGTKDEPKFKLKEPGENLSMVFHLADLPKIKTPKIIYRPVFEELTPDFYEEFFKWCYKRQNCIVWVDEAMSVSPTPYKIPEYYKAILTRGRERRTSVWSLTQRPSGIAQVIISESIHFFVFDLNLEQDRDKMASVTGCDEFMEKPGKTKGIPNFWYFNANGEVATKSYMVERG